MSGTIALAFAVGMLVTVTSCGLPLALAALGLCASVPDGGRPTSRGARIVAATETGALAGAAFAATFFAAAAFEGIGLEISDLVPTVALALAVALVVLGAVGLTGRSLPAERARGRRMPVAFAATYAIASLPCSLLIFEGLVEQTAKARGDAAVLGASILVAAGAVTAFIAFFLLAELFQAGVRTLGSAGAAIAGLFTVGGGLAAAVYWLPAVADGAEERGGAVEEPLGEISGALGEFVATYELGFALLLLAATVGALAAALRAPRASPGRG